MSGARRLPMVQRLGVLAAFNVAVYFAYIQVIERSKQRGGSFSKDGYDYWSMFKKPKHQLELEEKVVAEKKAQG
ncbi:hypothetical protein MPTK1_5g13110 [Marchantia polymorpha subsp. ruderalis]|uniref:Uncharacterized protein n=2 Tax=Marchantia polymorpha TaxID=3197 RepID=A0A176VWB5_MARPO|nr:hypothetical protein AXG93_1964s1030 [Marchantia polymorpha subsp. ruderalis]PTQ41793.1 hypothetical protein MARPO_0032s0005 [Marchantia polymorpha]BBN11578.1 hypothetical protein Mp_5g13110 [Marchantia polymorpha subsp. ruderalis]|eukprot:PTQ41793.1 hypothetical protein MARPO_0032s0005 [Marchantia polymorpha]